MNKSMGINVNPIVLQELHRTSGYTTEEIAKKLETSPENINDMESGNVIINLEQIKLLANLYKRPLVAFFIDTVPTLPTPVDYRINRDKSITPKVYLSERRAFYLSNKLSELTGKRSQIPNFPSHLTPIQFAMELRKYLKIDLIKLEKAEEILSAYKQIIEEKLLISIVELELKSSDVRGFCIINDISVIVLNESDNYSIKLFTLFHELCHLLKNTFGVCSITFNKEEQEIETFCNKFAAEFLIPADDLKRESQKFSTINEDTVAQLTNLYGVSKQVIMIRLLELDFIDRYKYEQFKNEGIKKKSGGRRNWDKVFKNRNGNFVINETANAFQSGKISYSEVVDILNIKTKYIEKFFSR
jgi:Zn-dependent peptidase ImmA (M78 family)